MSSYSPDDSMCFIKGERQQGEEDNVSEPALKRSITSGNALHYLGKWSEPFSLTRHLIYWKFFLPD